MELWDRSAAQKQFLRWLGVVAAWNWNGPQLKTAFQLHSNFVPIGSCFGLPLPDVDPVHGPYPGDRRRPRPSADRSPCWACGAPINRRRRWPGEPMRPTWRPQPAQCHSRPSETQHTAECGGYNGARRPPHAVLVLRRRRGPCCDAVQCRSDQNAMISIGLRPLPVVLPLPHPLNASRVPFAATR